MAKRCCNRAQNRIDRRLIAGFSDKTGWYISSRRLADHNRRVSKGTLNSHPTRLYIPSRGIATRKARPVDPGTMISAIIIAMCIIAIVSLILFYPGD